MKEQRPKPDQRRHPRNVNDPDTEGNQELPGRDNPAEDEQDRGGSTGGKGYLK